MKDGQSGVPRGQYSIEVNGSFVAEDVNLDIAGSTVLGRGAHLPNERWIPKQLVVIEPARGGWLVEVHRGPARLTGESMTATVDAGARVHCGPGSHQLEWSLPQSPVTLSVEVSVPKRWVDVRGMRRAALGGTTVYPVARLHVRDVERRTLAVAFRYLLQNEPKRKDHWATAGEELGMSGDQLRRWLHKRRKRLQRELAGGGRPVVFHELDDFGRWLVTEGRLKVGDLPPQR
ncbi:hypothetical protein ACQE98_11895 [Ornithinimicrobium sp. W1679]|uniref:hypothetical protein n=1 Tax=Ornithinimicrobium sp. W1679 TaxID=3418770 RepID=UPI003CE8E38C